MYWISWTQTPVSKCFGRFLLSEFAEWIETAEGMPTTLAPQLTNSRQPRKSKRTTAFDLFALTFGTIHLVG
jgi:hypothetical protein